MTSTGALCYWPALPWVSWYGCGPWGGAEINLRNVAHEVDTQESSCIVVPMTTTQTVTTEALMAAKEKMTAAQATEWVNAHVEACNSLVEAKGWEHNEDTVARASRLMLNACLAEDAGAMGLRSATMTLAAMVKDAEAHGAAAWEV